MNRPLDFFTCTIQYNIISILKWLALSTFLVDFWKSTHRPLYLISHHCHQSFIYDPGGCQVNESWGRGRPEGEGGKEGEGRGKRGGKGQKDGIIKLSIGFWMKKGPNGLNQ
jgi:hypothetical protein